MFIFPIQIKHSHLISDNNIKMEAENLFKKIIDILEPHYDTRILNPPATDKDLREFESIVGIVLPEDFKAIYKLHNGEYEYTYTRTGIQNYLPKLIYQLFNVKVDRTITVKSGLELFLGANFLSIQEIIQEYTYWEEWRKEHADNKELMYDGFKSIPKQTIQESFTATGWIPFAGDSQYQFLLDYSPGVKGVKGQVIYFSVDSPTHYQVSENFTAFLSFVLKQYRLKKYNHVLTTDKNLWYIGNHVDAIFDK